MNKLFALYFLVSVGAISWLSFELHKAKVCNRVFTIYFSLYGIDVDLDLMYKDARTWVYDPKYNNLPRRPR